MGAELLWLGDNRAHTAAANERPPPLSAVSPGLRPEERLGFNHTPACVRRPPAPIFLINCACFHSDVGYNIYYHAIKVIHALAYE